ncbi:MAG: hypothetical protein ABI687_09000 [Flavitalea sp.]
MKYSQWIGFALAIILIMACFLHWTWHPDLHKYFTGFYSEENVYGKPGYVLIFFALICSALYLTPRVWAKRLNIFICCFLLAYAIKSFILFSGCYHGICPVRQTGLWIVLSTSLLMMLAAVLPDLSVKPKAE